MEKYESAYYDYQTKARGLLDKRTLQERFEKLACWYKARLIKYMPKRKNVNCLDVPCGYGNFLYFLKTEGYENINGFDLDSNQIKLAQLLGLPAKVGDAFKELELNANKYDLISSMDFIEHLGKGDALKFLDLCYENLNAAGVLILRTPCADSPFGMHDVYNDLTHQWAMTSNLLNAILKMKGFSEIKIIDERPQPTSILNFIRWCVYFPATGIANIMCIALGMRPPKVWSRSMIVIAIKQ